MKELKQYQAKGYLTPEEKRLIRHKLKPYKKYLWRILALIILNIFLVFFNVFRIVFEFPVID